MSDAQIPTRPLPEYSDIASNMADLGKEEVPYSADDYLPSSPPSLDKRRKLAASETSPPGANRSPSDVRTSRAADEEGEVLDNRDSKRRRNDSVEHRHDDSRDHRREDHSTRRSVDRDHRGDRDGRRKDRDHGNGHHDRRDRRDDHRRERSHSRDRDRDRDSERGHRSNKSEKEKERDRHGEHRERGRERDQREHRGGGDRDKGSNRESRDRRRERSPPPAAAPPPPAPVEPVMLLNVEIKSQEEKEEEERRLIEERRKRRHELLTKLQQQQTAPVDSASAAATTSSVASEAQAVLKAASASSPVAAPTTPPKPDEDMFGEMSVAEKERLEKEKARVEAEEQQRQEREEEAQAEADRRALEKLWASSTAASAPAAGAPQYDEVEEMKEEAKEELEEAEFDMFADSPSKLTDKVVPLKVLVERREQRENPAMIDNWDDTDGYYKFRIGEVLADRYVVFNAYGKGVFSSVVRAKDLQNSENEVAIKLIRNNDVMYKAGQKELMILGLIRDADPENKRHCIRLLHHFEFRSHLCLVMEPLAMNLREVIRKYGKDVGLNLTAVKLYAKQMFIALRHLRKCNIIHADIKPDNILVNESKTTLKLCDFGSASLSNENEITPYLVSRFYRAPEIILGCPYDFALDMWSIGCCLVELYTGKILFEKGRTNNQMLRLMMEMRGKIPNKMLKKAMPVIRSQHFDDDLNFINKTVDPVTKKETAKSLQIVQPTRDLGTILNVSTRYLAEKDQKEVMQFKDLLERIFTFEAVKRITPKEALQHPFITGQALPTATKK